MLFSNFAAVALSLATSMALKVTGNDVRTGKYLDDFWEDVTVNKGASLYFKNENPHFYRNFWNNGEVYVSLERDLGFLSASFFPNLPSEWVVNNGLLVINSAWNGANPSIGVQTPNFYNGGQLFVNTIGNIGNLYSFQSANLTNDGEMMLYSQSTKFSTTSFGGINDITNNGAICLKNQQWWFTNNLKGAGCTTIGSGSNVWIGAFYKANQQTFYLSTSDATLRCDARLTGTPTFIVAGFGNGNVIGWGAIPITSTYYSGDTLQISNGISTVKFKIGTGYDKNLFKIVSATYGTSGINLNGGVVYNGPIPSGSTPIGNCGACPDVPLPPTTSSVVPSSTPTSTTPSSTVPTSSSTSPSSSAPPTSSAPPSSSAPVSSSHTPTVVTSTAGGGIFKRAKFI